MEIAACGESLEFESAVFTLHARSAERMNAVDNHGLLPSTPVQASPLTTKSWQDPALVVGPAVVSDTIIQRVGSLLCASGTAGAACA